MLDPPLTRGVVVSDLGQKAAPDRDKATGRLPLGTSLATRRVVVL